MSAILGRFTPVPRVFLSYRRSDSAGWAGRLYDSLQRLLPSTSLFMDVEDIPPGVDFERFIGDAVGNCDLLLTLIGPQWLEARDADGQRRLDDAADYTRLEVEAALKRDIRVIPVLVGGARMPRAAELPESLRPLLKRQNFELHDRGWDEGCQRLAQAIERAASGTSGAAGPAPPAPRVPPRRSWLWPLAGLAAAAALAIGIAVGASRLARPPQAAGDAQVPAPVSPGPTLSPSATTTPTQVPIAAGGTPGTPASPAPTSTPAEAAEPARPATLLDLGLEGTWWMEERGGKQPIRFDVERYGQKLALFVVLPDGSRRSLGEAGIDADRAWYRNDEERFSLDARAEKGSGRDWQLRFRTAGGDCAGGGGTAQASADLHLWRARLSCAGPRPQTAAFTAELASDGATMTITSTSEGGKSEGVTLRRGP